MSFLIHTGYRLMEGVNKAVQGSKSIGSQRKKVSVNKLMEGSSKAKNNGVKNRNKKEKGSKTTVTSIYKRENREKAAASTYKMPVGYSFYKKEISSSLSDSKKGIDSDRERTLVIQTSETERDKGGITNVISNLKSIAITSKIGISATTAVTKKKVEKTLSKATRELYESKDYIARLSKAYCAGLDSAGKQVCDEITEAIHEAKKAVNKKGGFGKEAINLLLEGCEQFTNNIIKASLKIGKLTVKAALALTEKAVWAIGKAIDFINPGEDLQSPKKIIQKVEKGSIKLTNNLQKGNYGEMKMDQYYASKGYVRISICRVMDINDPAHQGIDGVYYNIDRQKGEPEFIIAEAKYNTSKLGYTKYDGKQMSDRWIMGKNRIESAVGYAFAKEVILAINKGKCEKQVFHVFPDGTYEINKIK